MSEEDRSKKSRKDDGDDDGRDFRMYHPETGGSKFYRKAKESPIMSIGLIGGVGVLAYMMYGLKHRDPNSKLSVYLIHTRLGVQGTVIGALCLGMIASIYQEQVKPRWEGHTSGANPKKVDD